MTGTSKEIWRDIPGYEGKYQASNLGRIRSLSRRVRLVTQGKETTRLMKGRILRPGKFCKSGHLSVVLGHRAHGSPVHQLVALTFIGPCPKDMEVLHGDGNPTNNCIENLRYGTRTENILDTFKNGGRWRKLTTDDVQQIRKLFDSKIDRQSIAIQFGISVSHVYTIGRRLQYEWLN